MTWWTGSPRRGRRGPWWTRITPPLSAWPATRRAPSSRRPDAGRLLQALRTAAVIRLLLRNALRVDEACAADVADLGADAGASQRRVQGSPAAAQRRDRQWPDRHTPQPSSARCGPVTHDVQRLLVPLSCSECAVALPASTRRLDDRLRQHSEPRGVQLGHGKVGVGAGWRAADTARSPAPLPSQPRRSLEDFCGPSPG